MYGPERGMAKLPEKSLWDLWCNFEALSCMRRPGKTQPDLPKDASLEVTLHEVVISDALTLYLVTSLSHDADTLAGLFKFRVQVEFDIRNLKVVMDTENIRAKSVDMFTKELFNLWWPTNRSI